MLSAERPPLPDAGSRDEDRDVACVHSHCGIYTRADVASAMLDAIGWSSDLDLSGKRLLEPCCGDGAFLLPAVDRLLTWARREGRLTEAALFDAMTAYEFDRRTAEDVRAAVALRLANAGLTSHTAQRLASRWVRTEDFLLAKGLDTYSHIVGNPPYMRWSKLPLRLRMRYEASIDAVAAKGDICLAFIWRCADLADEHGSIALLCADRWLRCAYGEKARAELAKRVRLAAFFETHDLPVFAGRREVSAYAGVTIFDRHSGGAAVSRPESLDELFVALRRWRAGSTPKQVAKIPSLRAQGSAILAPAEGHDLLTTLADRFPTLANAGVDVRCGVALGHAKTFVVGAEADIEPDRLVPYVGSEDLQEDGSTASSRMLVNPWNPDGSLVDLARWPRLAKHFEASREALEARACVSGPQNWYRTIDRLPVDRSAGRLFVAGMARRSRVALSKSDEVPGNAIYVLGTRTWPSAALFTVLRSGLLDVHAAGFASTFAGGTKRFDGNFLRQVRLPLWSMVGKALRARLVEADHSVSLPSADLLGDVLRLRSARERRVLERLVTARVEESA